MKASPDAQRRLLTLQEIDTRIAVLARARGEIPQIAELDDATRQLADIMSSMARLEGDVEEAMAEVDRFESDVAVARERLAQDEKRLAASSDPKVSLALEHEMETLRRRLNDLEDAELDVMERQEVAERARAEARDATATITGHCRDLETALAREGSRIEAEVNEAARLREDIVLGLPPDLVALYERQRDRYGIGAALLLRGVSQASGMRLTEADLDEIRRAAADDVVICPESSCILIRSDESWTSCA